MLSISSHQNISFSTGSQAANMRNIFSKGKSFPRNSKNLATAKWKMARSIYLEATISQPLSSGWPPDSATRLIQISMLARFRVLRSRDLSWPVNQLEIGSFLESVVEKIVMQCSISPTVIVMIHRKISGTRLKIYPLPQLDVIISLLLSVPTIQSLPCLRKMVLYSRPTC